MRGIASDWRASDLSPGQFDPASPPGRRQLAGGGIAWRGGIRETHTGFASLRRYRRDALAVAALMAVLDGVDVPTPA